MTDAPTTDLALVGAPSTHWWESRMFVGALILLSAVPLIYPPIPPLVDLLGHMGRYRVELDVSTSPWLGQYYSYDWQPIGNLGVDLLVVPLARLFGLELAVKLIVLAIPPLTIAGFLWVAREVHGRIPPTALFALPFAYSHPFMFGFVNFSLSVALAFLAFGLWLHLARRDRLKLRAALFVPISIVIYFTHTFGWGMLGLLCFSAEAVRQHDHGRGWLRSGLRAALYASAMALPLLFMLAWRSSIEQGETGHWFDLMRKTVFLIEVLRDRWKWFDILSLCVCLMIIVEARRQKTLTFSRNLAFSALVLLAGFIVMPYLVFSSAYADMRLIPYVLAVALLAIRFRGEMPKREATALAIAGLAFFLVRVAGNTVSLAIAANDQSAMLRALEHVQMGARVASLVGQRGCDSNWPLARNNHLGALVIVRKHGFSNDQWQVAGANLMQIHYPAARAFEADPSEMIANGCSPGWRSLERAFAALPRGAFDYVWLIDSPAPNPSALRGMELAWSGRGARLYRVTATP
jgi:hypothetical protein